ncbi:sensor histidine kinase [Streptomyces jumonjinensis]|uniref:sensor histidine kinase n=1 Tax=Streptomyces jumonjinensis TaxID=1945 RepID=UPI002B1ED42E|nr:histidine kinase [Streptomyces jumonjinensis]
MTEKTRSPEYRLTADSLAGLRQDLFHHAFAYRPLPPTPTDGPLTRRLPEGIRPYAAWTRHALVGFGALITVSVGISTSSYSASSVFALLSMVPAVAVLMTLIRPVGAFWISLLSAPVVAAASPYWDIWPWAAAGLFSHLVVMGVVALRTRPRTAGWMWVLTACYSLIIEGFLSGGSSTNSHFMLVLAALVLLVTTLVHVRREAKQEVAAQQSVTAVERDRRTLLEERTTIARELHDVVAHHMSVVAIQAEAAPYRVENPPPELEKAFATIRENAVAALTELRRILGVVRAEDYEAPDAPQPVLADLDRLLANVREAGLEAEKSVTGAVRPLPQGVELSAYRIIQEALSNALRHAPGSSAKVEISYVLGGFGLRVVNTAPRGLVKPSPGAGHGITGMKERVSMLGGELTNEPTEDGGYEVTAFIPAAMTAEEPA